MNSCENCIHNCICEPLGRTLDGGCGNFEEKETEKALKESEGK